MKQIFTNLEVSDLEALIIKCVSSCLSCQNTQPEIKPQLSPKYLTRKETAQILRVGLTKLNELAKNGVLPSYRIGCNVRFKEDEVMECLTQVNVTKGGKDV